MQLFCWVEKTRLIDLNTIVQKLEIRKAKDHRMFTTSVRKFSQSNQQFPARRGAPFRIVILAWRFKYTRGLGWTGERQTKE